MNENPFESSVWVLEHCIYVKTGQEKVLQFTLSPTSFITWVTPIYWHML